MLNVVSKDCCVMVITWGPLPVLNSIFQNKKVITNPKQVLFTLIGKMRQV